MTDKNKASYKKCTCFSVFEAFSFPNQVAGLQNSARKRVLTGTTPFDDVIRDIMDQMYGEATVEKSGDGIVLRLPAVGAVVKLDPHSSTIECGQDEAVRVQLRDILLKHLVVI